MHCVLEEEKQQLSWKCRKCYQNVKKIHFQILTFSSIFIFTPHFSINSSELYITTFYIMANPYYFWGACKMKIKLLSLCLILILSLSFISGCVDKQTKTDKNTTTISDTVDEAKFAEVMKEANTAYIKALVSTSQKNVSASQAAIDELVNKLTYMSDNYGQAPPAMYANDTSWTTEIERAKLIASNSQELLAGGDIEAAHTALEPMRDLFYSLHERNGVIHMGDLLTIFHATMEEAIGAANANDTEKVATYVPKLKSEWQNVTNADKPSSADENYAQVLGQVDNAIVVLNNSVSSGNLTEVKTNSENLRLAFSKTFAKYGVVIS